MLILLSYKHINEFCGLANTLVIDEGMYSFTTFPTSNNPIAYAVNLAMSLAQSIGNGRPVLMDNSVVSSETVAQNISVDDIIMMHETNQTPQNGMPNVGMGVDDILNPNRDGDNKKPYMGDGFGGEGGSILTPFIDNKGDLRLINVADKTLRLGGDSARIVIPFQNDTT